MSVRSRLQPLLTLRGRRVTQAMQVVEARNKALRQKELERDAALERWNDAVRALHRQQQGYVEAVTSNLHRDVSSNALAVAAARCDWWRARVAEFRALLQAAEGALLTAQAAASAARRDYLRAVARHDALVTFAERQKGVVVAQRMHAEELAVEDLQAGRGREGRAV